MRALGQFFVCLISLSAFAGEDSVAPQENREVLVGASFAVNGITAVNDNQEDAYWLASSGEAGILKITRDRKIQSIIPGRYQLIDSVKINQQDLIAALNDASDQVEVLYGKAKYALQTPGFNIDGLCLFRDRQNHVFLYLMDGYGGVEVRWIYQGTARQFIDIQVKSLPTAPGIESCAANSATQSLYLLEETLGVWQYPAAVETAPYRHLLLHAANEAEYRAMAVTDNALFVAEADKIAYYTYSPGEEKSPHALKLKQSWYVGEREPQDLAYLNYHSAGFLAYLDDLSSVVYLIKFTPEAPQEASQVKGNYPEVVALRETQPMDSRGDTADDPAIWVHPTRPQRSVILATNKRLGLMVYDLEGQLLQSLPVGKVNNVDIRQNNLLRGTTMDIAVASNRTDQSLQFFSIDKKGRVADAGRVATGLDDVYGVCLYRESPEALYAFINDKDGRVQQYRIALQNGQLGGQRVAEFKLSSQPEGCVVDDRRKHLFIGEEDRGVWRYGFKPSGIVDEKTAKLIAGVGDTLVADVEGLALYIKGNQRYLLVSSQGDNSYAVFQADQPHTYVASFRVGLNSRLNIDGTSATDGLAVSSAFFNQDFPLGMLVIQDGFNLMPTAPQNFKLVPWEEVSRVLGQ